MGDGGRTRGLDLILRHGARVPGKTPVLDAHDACRVIFGKLRVVRDHDHEPLARDLREQIHHLDARLGIEGARGLIGENDLGIIHQRACDGDALHLAARELRWLLVHMRAQAHALERGTGATLPLSAVHARQRERELHVGQNRLMRNEVVALEDEAHTVVAVCVPFRIRIVTSRGSVHHDVARVGVVEAAQYVQERGLAGTRWAQNRHELALPEGDGDAVQGALDQVPGLICLGDVANLDHAQPIHVMSYSLFVPTFPAFRRTWGRDTKTLCGIGETGRQEIANRCTGSASGRISPKAYSESSPAAMRSAMPTMPKSLPPTSAAMRVHSAERPTEEPTTWG